MRTKCWALAMGAVVVAALVSVPGAQAASRTIGPIKSQAGLTCYVTASVVNSAAPTTGLPDITYGSSWSCSGGTRRLSAYSYLSDELNERIAGVGTGRSATNFFAEQCSDDNHCSQSAHFQSLPGATYVLTARPNLRSYYTLNGDNSDDDYFVSWPSMCTGHQLFAGPAVAQLVRCDFSVSGP